MDTADTVGNSELNDANWDLSQEKDLIFSEFCELLQFKKPANFSFYVFSKDERLFSFAFTGNDETYYKELTYSSILLSLIDHPKFLFIYNTFLPYMGGVENDAVVMGLYDQHEDLDLKQVPYSIDDGSFEDLSEKLTINPSVSLISDEILITLKTIKLAHFNDKHSMITTSIEFLESCGIEFCFYGNNDRYNIEEKLDRHYIVDDFKTVVRNIDKL